MAKPALVKSLILHNILSFGDEATRIELRPLNVLIGPNGSGKSNLIEAISVLKAAPRDLLKVIREGGGTREWLWKGAAGTPTATIEAVVGLPTRDASSKGSHLRYCLSFTEVEQLFRVTDEQIDDQGTESDELPSRTYLSYAEGRPTLVPTPDNRPEIIKSLVPSTPRDPAAISELFGLFNPQQSVIAQRRDPERFPELTYLGELFGSFRLYRNWSFGRDSQLRIPQPVDLPNDVLLENGSNLGLIINRLNRDAQARRALRQNLQTFYEDAQEIDVKVEGGTVQVFLFERDYTVPASRLSDGTLRWIALLAILLHPSPPPLVCLEEPELGLHPDMIPTLATLLKEASQRMQLVVTTHSDSLVNELTDTPEAVVVCEKANGRTTLRRLEHNQLAAWLEDYSLGQLWTSGEIGGNRW